MLKNNLILAFRTFKKYLGFNVINISGLSLSIALVILAFLYVQDELSFDSFHKKGERIFRVNQKIPNEILPGIDRIALTPAALGPVLVNELPEVAAAARMRAFELVVNKNENSFREKVLAAEEGFFDMFSFKIKYGDTNTPLAKLNSIVISERTAKKYFDDEDPVSQLMRVQFGGQFHDFYVSAVVENPPGNTSIHFDFMIPYKWLIDYNEIYEAAWVGQPIYTFIELHKGASRTVLENKLPGIVDKYMGDRIEERGNPRDALKYLLLPVNELHLETSIHHFPSILPLGPPPGNILYSYMLISISVIILIIACINYVTFSIGHSVKRAKEVGIRKTLGAEKKGLVSQFLGENLIITFFALIIGVGIAQLLLPYFNVLVQKEIPLFFWTKGKVIGLFVGLWLFVSLLSGLYPALLLSAFKPIKVLKNRVKLGGKNILARLLVGFQYMATIVLIISVIIISKQLNYMQEQTFDIQGEKIMLIKNQRYSDNSYYNSFKILKGKLKQQGIDEVTGSYGIVGDNHFWLSYLVNNDTEVEVRAIFADFNYVDFYEHSLLEGRYFEEERGGDKKESVVVNEKFVKVTGLENPVGTIINNDIDWLHEKEVEIIGVVKDFHFESLHTEVEPAVFLPLNDEVAVRYVSLKFPANQTGRVLEAARSAWEEVFPVLSS